MSEALVQQLVTECEKLIAAIRRNDAAEARNCANEVEDFIANNCEVIMDPNQALIDARKACEHWSKGERGDHDLVAFDELVNAFEALDRWLCSGGFLPRDWQIGKRFSD